MRPRLFFFSTLAVLIMIAFAVVIVKSINTPPKAEASAVTTKEDTPVEISLAGTDRQGDPLTFSVVGDPSHGRLSGTSPNLIYSPGANFNGSDSLTFKVNDGKADSAEATVSIAVTPVNDLPTANDDSAAAEEDTPIVTIDVLANDTDLDNSRLMVVDASQGAAGSVTINTNSTLTYAPNKDFCGTDTFTYTLSDGNGGTDTATVTVTVSAVNDPPRITSKPAETARVWAPYTYDVEARDPDTRDSLVYSLAKFPEGMTIDATLGLIKWRPTSAQAGTFDVEVKVADSHRIRAWDTQGFTITVTSLSSPLTTTLAVADCFSRKGAEKLSAKDKVPVVETSDNNRIETGPRSNMCYDFCDGSIPKGAAIKSLIVCVEHFEDPQFPRGKLEWSVGAGWPAKPAVWASIEAPVRQGEAGEAMDSWDVTSSVETPEKVNSLQLQIQNNDASGRGTTSVDHIYAVVEWY
ncbi:MAG: tandem-95 repeat protein [Phycisphaerales bacterium]|nr:MAG: tandem-95 repeat protein [Phycisphaerales bacterium]